MAGTKRPCCNICCFYSSPSSDEKGQDHSASAGPRSSPFAIGQSFYNTYVEMAGNKRSCCNRFCCFSSSASDEEGQDHPASAGPGSLPSAIYNTTETLSGPPERTEALVIPGSSNVATPRKDEIEQHVDPNLDVSGTHKCDKAPLPESQNILWKSEGEDVNAHPSVSGATQCDEPSSSGSSNLPVKSEGEHVDVNPNVSEAPSSSSSTGVTKSDVIRRIKHIDQADGEKVDVNLDQLVDHISELLKLREEEKHRREEASNPSSFDWPDVNGLQKLKAILSWGTDLRNLKQMFSPLFERVSTLKDVISGPVTTILRDIAQVVGQASVVAAGLLVVAYTLERFQELSDNKDRCWVLIKEMNQLASVVKKLEESPKKTLDVIEEATALVVEGAIMCCTHIDRSYWKRFLLASKYKADLSDLQKKLYLKYLTITVDIAISNSADIERLVDIAISNSAGIERLSDIAISNSAGIERLLDIANGNLAGIECLLAAIKNPLSRIYPDHAVGIEDSIKDVVSYLEIESDDQNVVTVILHGFRGMGKTTLADAVVSKLVGFKYSKVRLGKDPVIENLQKNILKDLMEPGEAIPKITAYEEGQRELLNRLEKVEAFIYIDDVLDGKKLNQLLPEDMRTAKKVRLLLTARNEDVSDACPMQSTKPKIYKMKGIEHQEALIILKRQINFGIDDDQFNQIIRTCGGIPLMLTLAANFIGRAENIEKACYKLVNQKKTWLEVAFEEMREAYDALPHDCIEPFLDICSYFKGWAWETVEVIVGKDKLKRLERTALVTRTNDVAFVHDVILTLAHQKSKDSEGKEVRLAFTSASKLMEFLEDEGAEGIKGIWLSDNTDVLEISAATLDLMSKSLRVLRLGNLTGVQGKCSKRFQELVFFEANVRELPFHDVSKLKKLRHHRCLQV